ncbi:hypothetical protein PBT90_07445 [Algoriphagus halophytocola]|uniref:Uncharacterized protein n=1 Tax=Algoriphagus halophytocola TaxID=2991499 RepID=A0ABY6MHG4_9BACT|nr:MULTISPECIES: hypothetical protein [unclassified Algoriphagus]UZD23222.1 hypothetical protein OM944_01760 [Algoriphagus sp. TR-M5]WBL44515.1 hypothetical protein PBT90_07445 [Algoriphagus sp. TR-M9]
MKEGSWLWKSHMAVKMHRDQSEGLIHQIHTYAPEQQKGWKYIQP